MANDYDDLYDLDNISDEDLKDLVLQELSEYPEIDVDLIEIRVDEGRVVVAGRVGTEQEIQQVQQVLTDVIGLDDVTNELVVDELARGERSEGADEAWQEDFAGNPQMTQGTTRTSDTAEHLTENLEAEQFGTQDAQEAIERGTAYEPPDHPVQEGSTRENH